MMKHIACSHTTMKQLCISKVPIFNHLSPQEMVEITKLSNRLLFKKGEIIFHPEEYSQQLFIIHQGRVKIYRLTESGKEQLLRILEPGNFMGELSLFTEIPLSSYAEALEATEICAIHRQDLHELILKHPTISLKILEEFSKRLNRMETLLEQLNTNVEERIISYLMELAKEKTSDLHREPISITLPMSKKDFASFIGTSQETLSRRLTSFQKQGLISQSGQRKITILNMNGLQQLKETR